MMGVNPLAISTQGFSVVNASQGHKPSYQQAIYRSQMMGANPLAILTQGFSAVNASQAHKPSYQQAIYRSQ